MQFLLVNLVYILSLVILMDLFEKIMDVQAKSALIGEDIRK